MRDPSVHFLPSPLNAKHDSVSIFAARSDSRSSAGVPVFAMLGTIIDSDFLRMGYILDMTFLDCVNRDSFRFHPATRGVSSLYAIPPVGTAYGVLDAELLEWASACWRVSAAPLSAVLLPAQRYHEWPRDGIG